MPDRVTQRLELEPAASTPPMESFTTHPRDRRPAVVADANALIADSVRRARGLFSLMPFLAEHKLINLLTAEHIDAKVYEHLPEACEHSHVDLTDATLAYETFHRPLLRFVNVGDLMLHDDRVGTVALADREDVPVAQLGVLLAPSLVLTRDPHLLDADIGVSEWADALVLMKQLIELDEMMWGATSGVVLAGAATAAGVKELVQFLRRSELALSITIGLTLVLGYQFRQQLRSAPGRLRAVGGEAFERTMLHMASAFERRAVSERRLQRTLVRPHPAERLEAMVARVLVQSHERLPAAAVHARLPLAWRDDVAVEDVMGALRDNPHSSSGPDAVGCSAIPRMRGRPQRGDIPRASSRREPSPAGPLPALVAAPRARPG